MPASICDHRMEIFSRLFKIDIIIIIHLSINSFSIYKHADF